MATASDLYKKVMPLFEGIEGQVATEGTVYDLCWYSVEIRKLQNKVAGEGSVIDTPKGDKPNPAAVLLHQYMTDKNNCLKALLPLLKGKPTKDALLDFIGR